ncbi:MAG TPA: PAS domain S-box protein [Acetobacteraceae bacterium]|nr:PAS domain S-box protein [Acetobacteraceae bacterium]
MTDPFEPLAPRRDEGHALLAAITASSNDAIVAKDLVGTVTYWNDAATRLFGYTPDEIIGRSITLVIPPERIGEEQSILERVGRGERLTHFETRRVTKDGRAIAVSLTISPIHDTDGTIIGVSKIARDLSEMQRLNGALQQREALLSSVLDTVPDGLIVIDERGIVQSFSPAAARMFGFSPAEVVGRNVKILTPSSHTDAHDSYIERYLATGERRIIGIGRVVVGRRKDGTTFPMELQIGEAFVDGTRRFTGFVRDLTEREDRDRRLAELQSELIHVGRLSELGQMVSALAHEVNQPLTAMGNYLIGIRRLLPNDTPPVVRQAIDKVMEQSERARGIVQSLRGLVKKESRPREVVNLESMILETSALVMVGAMRAVHLDLRIADDAAYAFLDKVQIQQVLLNLMRNAVEAMAASDIRTLTVATTRLGERVAIRVADTGPGLSETVKSRLFQPFVTTKSEGLGVGLSICRTIVETHGGELTADSEPGRGAAFHFTVPATPAQGDGEAASGVTPY